MSLRTDKLINREEIKEELRLIEESDRDYITPTGKIYGKYPDGRYYPKASFVNKHNGYIYTNIHLPNGRCVSRRLHRLLAIAYIPNPNNYPVVMHIDNNKENISLDNLKWGTESENTQQAVDDGLLVNDKGACDSQSIQVNMYETTTTNLINEFGSVSEAERITGVSKTTILNSCNNKYKDVRKPFYFRYKKDGNVEKPNCIAMYQYDTEELIGLFYNMQNAADEMNMNIKTIETDVRLERKPNVLFKNRPNVFFRKIYR